jgi:hypothetical protein
LLLQKKRENRTQHGSHGFRTDLNGEEVYRSTTAYPHPHAQSPDMGYMGNSSSMSPGGSTGALAYMLPGGERGCEIHMNSNFPHLPPGMALGPDGVPHYAPQPPLPWGLNWLRPVIMCCRTKSLLSKFPSRAKRIDVISRFIFPLIFAVFNLAYWLYYLFAKSKSPQMDN